MKQLILYSILLIFLTTILFVILSYPKVEIIYSELPAPKSLKIEAYVTGYNTVEWQTDDTPCYAGDIYICGRNDVVACPRWIPKGTWVKIDKRLYECIDRLALKYNSRFDISCDKDFECPYEMTGYKMVTIYERNQSK